VNDYPPGWSPQPSALEQALSSKLDALVAAGQLTESQAAQILPGYGYPELLLWVRPPADQLDPPPLDSVLVLGEQLRTEQARQRYWQTRAEAEADLNTTRTRQDSDQRNTVVTYHDSDDLTDGT